MLFFCFYDNFRHKNILQYCIIFFTEIFYKGGKCCKCGYDKCVDALEFHHENPNEKEFKLGSGNTVSWQEYKEEVLKCILVCSNCHKEIHSKIGYK